MTCEHENSTANVEVNRITDGDDGPLIGFSADIRIWCDECGEPFVFVGLPVGMLPNKATMSVDGTELRVPMRPQSADPHFGMGLPGFEARLREGSAGADN